MIRGISDICLQDALIHVHTFTSKYRAAHTPQRTARGTRQGFQVETPRPPIGAFPIVGFRLEHAPPLKIGKATESGTLLKAPKPLERHG